MHLRLDRLRLPFLLALLGCAAGCATCRVPAPQESGEVRVNTYLPGDQWQPTAAQSAHGSVVVWSDGGIRVGEELGLFGQRFDDSGQRTGEVFRVDAEAGAPGRISRLPDVAMNAAGEWVVVWEDHAAIPDTADVRVFARRFGANGRPIGDRFEVTVAPTRRAAVPAVAISASGAFAVVWHGVERSARDPKVFVRRYSCDGSPLGGPARVDSVTVPDQTANQTLPDIAMTPAGASVVTWFDYSIRTSTGDSRRGADVYARRYRNDGVALGDPILVHQQAPRVVEKEPSVAMDPSGAFIVAWHTEDQVTEHHGTGISAQRFHQSGARVGEAIAVSPPSEASQAYPTVALGPDGRALVVWKRARRQGSGELAESYDVFAQRLGRNGLLGDPFRVNQTSVGYTHVSSVAMDPAGNALIAWDATHVQGGVNADVYVRRYRTR